MSEPVLGAGNASLTIPAREIDGAPTVLVPEPGSVARMGRPVTDTGSRMYRVSGERLTPGVIDRLRPMTKICARD